MKFNDKVMSLELERLENLINTTKDRYVEHDINVLENVFKQIKVLLENDISSIIVEDVNMWSECHESLDRVMIALNVSIDNDSSDFDNYTYVFVNNNK